MKPLPLTDLLPVLNGKVVTGSRNFIVTDVKTKFKGLAPGTMVFDLNKKSLIYHNFKDYRKRIVIVTDKKAETGAYGDYVIVIVKDVKKALSSFISYYRRLFSIPVIGVTGTAGKTTTKEMLAHIFRGDRKVQCTYKSMNGMALNLKYLLGINNETGAAVIEMALTHPGNVRTSGKYFKPQIGIITNIGTAHLETCGTLERYISAKSEMMEALDFRGTLLLNGDDDNIKKIDLSPYKGDVLYFGQSSGCEFLISNIQYKKKGMEFQLLNRVEETVYVPGYGEHNIYNATAAIAAAHLTGVDLGMCIKRIRSFVQMERHLSVERGINGATIIDDTWNSNPTSAIAALNVLMKLAEGKKTIAVFHKLQRLGSKMYEEHRKLGQSIAENGIDLLITVGKEAKSIGEAAKRAGMDPNKIFNVLASAKLKKKLSLLADENSTILIKMSLGKMDSSYRSVLKELKSSG